MLETKVREAIAEIHKLNEELDENSSVYAFPFDSVLLEAILHRYKEYIGNIFMPKSEENDDEDMCPYLIAQAETDTGGYLVLVFTSGDDIEKLKKAVRNVMRGKDIDSDEE